jgi:putative hydrolase of the HAD superfamily
MDEIELENIKSIWFDFGRVLLPLDLEATKMGLVELGATQALQEDTQLFDAWERGELSRHAFYQGIKKHVKGFASIPSIRAAWNAMLLDLPRQNFKFLQRLKDDYQLLLVSNTNAVHIESIKQNMGLFRYHQFLNLFDEVFYSYEMGARKPEAQFFDIALKASGFKPEECLLIDDNEANIKQAEAMGFETWLYDPESDVLRFSKLKMAR